MKFHLLPVVIFTTAAMATGCTQFTTSDAELANLKSVADTRADEYIGCMKTEAGTLSSTDNYEFIADAVNARCNSSMDAYQSAQKEYLTAQFMMTGKQLAASVAALEKRGKTEVTEYLLARDAGTEDLPQPAAQPTFSESPSRTPPAGSVAPASAAMDVKWNPEQRVYLDCMDEQADKYMRLNESAEAIANVAADKCKSYLTVESRAALAEEGKVRVMGKIMDMRLTPR